MSKIHRTIAGTAVLATLALLLWSGAPVLAQAIPAPRVIATIPNVGFFPAAVAVDEVAHRVYVAHYFGPAVSIVECPFTSSFGRPLSRSPG